ncbi:hypothetical protein ACLOJK_008110 [Asimina triloba]
MHVVFNGDATSYGCHVMPMAGAGFSGEGKLLGSASATSVTHQWRCCQKGDSLRAVDLGVEINGPLPNQVGFDEAHLLLRSDAETEGLNGMFARVNN